MLQISTDGEPQFYHRTNGEFSLKNVDQVRTEFLLAPRTAKEAEDHFWQVPYPSQGWAFCTEEAAPLGTPASIDALENGAQTDLAALREAITSGSLDSYPDMKAGLKSEIVRAMEITTSNVRRVGNATNSTDDDDDDDDSTGITVTQVISFTFPDSVTTTTYNDGSDGYQSLCNYAYGLELTIWTSADGWESGCSVSSTAADASRRSSLDVTFVATVSAANADAAEDAANAIDTDSMDTALASVIASEDLDLTAPVTDTVEDPTVTETTPTPAPTNAPTAAPTIPSASSASSGATVGALAMGAALLALCRW